MLNCFRLWRRRRKVLVEYAQNNQSFRRLIQRTDDLESFHKALLDAFEDELVPVIAGATGLTEYDVKNYKEPLRISNVIQLTCLSEASGRSPIADGKEITDCEVLRVDIQDTMTINTTAFIEDQENQELPPGPYRIWCPAHSNGQGYLKLGSKLEITGHKECYTVLCNASRDDGSYLWFIKEKDESEKELYSIRVGREEGHRLYAGEDTAFATESFGGTFAECLFHLVQIRQYPLGYFRIECRNFSYLLRVGNDDVLKTERKKDFSLIDPCFLFVLCN